MIRIYAFEHQIERSARSPRSRTQKYGGVRSNAAKQMLASAWRAAREEAEPMEAPELISRFGAKSLYQSPALRGFGKGDA